MNDLEIFTRQTKEEKELLENPLYMDTVGSLIPIIQQDLNKAFKPQLWGNLINNINACIEADQFIEQSEEDENIYLFGMVAKFSPSDDDVLHIARLAMAFKKNEEGEVTGMGQLLLDITVQSVGKTAHSELLKFNDMGMIEKYRTKGDLVTDKIVVSLNDVRSLDTVYKHLLLPVQDFVVRVDGEETNSTLYMLNKEKVAVVGMSKLNSKTSKCAASMTSGFESESDGAVLTTRFIGTCTTSTNDPSGNLQFMHTTVNVQHILSAKG